jgi:PQQ-like domain
MKKLVALFTVLACSAADWICAGGEQKHEKILSVDSVAKLRLVVKLKLGGKPLGAPVIVGRLVTHKGIKDLVFVASASGDIYAVDPDLGTLFWQRRLSARTIGLVLQPGEGDDADDDPSMGLRALFVSKAHGNSVALNAGSGANLQTRAKQPCSSSSVQSALANGVRFVLATDQARPILKALDANSGRELYRSGNEIAAPVDSSGLAIANGHVCFGDTQGTLYCFGFPVDL